MQVKKGIISVGVLDPNLEVFDVVIPTEWGTTYNAYYIDADKPTLIDTVKKEFAEEYFANLAQHVDFGDLKYLVVNHTEPDHSGAVKMLLKKAPQITVVGSRAAIQFLKEQVNVEFKNQVVGHNDTLDLGGRTLRFIMAPFLHWPDTMFSYLEEDKVLFSCDGFGCHYCPPEGKLFESENSDFTEAVLYYYNSIMSPFKSKILEAVEKVRQVEINTIAPGHGPILDKDPWRIVDLYEQWSQNDVPEKRRLVVGYVSAYGHTRKMAELIAEGARKNSQVDVELFDVADLDEDALKSAVNHFDGLVIGSPTFNADAVEPIWRTLSFISAINAKGRMAAVFGNYGWSGEAAGLIEQRLEKMRMVVAHPPLKIRFGLSAEDEQKCREFGETIASGLV